MKNSLILFLLLLPSLAQADNTCFDPAWKQVRYESEKRGTTIFYITPEGYKATATNLACIFGIEFLQQVHNLPERATVGLMSEDYRSLHLIQWNLKDDYLLFLESDIPKNMVSWSGTYTKYPEALERIKEILVNKPFPKPHELPRTIASKIKTNYVNSSISGNKELLGEEE